MIRAIKLLLVVIFCLTSPLFMPTPPGQPPEIGRDPVPVLLAGVIEDHGMPPRGGSVGALPLRRNNAVVPTGFSLSPHPANNQERTD